MGCGAWNVHSLACMQLPDTGFIITGGCELRSADISSIVFLEHGVCQECPVSLIEYPYDFVAPHLEQEIDVRINMVRGDAVGRRYEKRAAGNDDVIAHLRSNHAHHRGDALSYQRPELGVFLNVLQNDQRVVIRDSGNCLFQR